MVFVWWELLVEFVGGVVFCFFNGLSFCLGFFFVVLFDVFVWDFFFKGNVLVCFLFFLFERGLFFDFVLIFVFVFVFLVEGCFVVFEELDLDGVFNFLLLGVVEGVLKD